MLRSISTRTAGLAIAVLAIWGGVIPFVGPYFHFTLGPDQTWTWTAGRFWLSVLPAIVGLIGGLWLLGAGPWASGRVGALMALAAGIWFAVGPELSTLWHTGGVVGQANGTPVVQAMERLGMHSGLGAVMAALAGFALPMATGRRRRVAVEPEPRPAVDREPATEVAPAAAGAPERAEEPVPARSGEGEPVTAPAGEPVSDSTPPREHVGT